MRFFYRIFGLLVLTAAVGCQTVSSFEGQALASSTDVVASNTAAPTFTPGAGPTMTDSTESSPTGQKPATPVPDTPAVEPTPTFDALDWESLPVIPELSPRAIEILKDGLAKGQNPHAFSKIGDCESQASWFLGDFDLKPQVYSLGSYENELQPVVEYYPGSFKRLSLAARPGFSAASLMAPIWADKQICEKNETPIACEYRVQKPIMAFILLGSNDATNPKTFEGHIRKVIEFSMDAGVLPVLGTKADNTEGDHYINATIARLGYEYQIPVWNYWAAVQDLPGHGLQEDGVHLTFGTAHFDDPNMMKTGWTVRNLNALQVLETVMEQTEQIQKEP